MANRFLIFSFLCLGILTELPAQILLYSDHNIPVSGSVSSMHFSADNRFLACGTRKGMVLVWDLDAQRKLHELKHGADVKAVYIDSKSRYVVSGGSNKMLIIWDLYTGEKIRVIDDYKGKINHLAISPDEKTLSVAGSKKDIYIFQFPEGELTGTLRNGHQKEVIFTAFNRTGDRLVSVGLDNQMVFWDTGNKRALRKSEIAPHTINESGIEIQTAGITPNMTKLVIAYRETRLAKGGKSMIFRYNTAIYDWQTGMLENIIEGNVKNIEAFTITPDGKYYITDNSTLRLKKINFWDIQSGEVVKNQQIDEDLTSVAVSNQGNWLALAAESGNRESGGEIKVFRLSGLGSLASIQVKSSQEPAINDASSSKPSQFGFPASTNAGVDIAGRYYALIIGINEYEDPVINDLDAPLTDAQNLYKILSSAYSFNQEDILFLENPGRAEIIDGLDYLERVVTSDDNLLIFYAGHGHWDENSHKGYWLPADASHESTANWLRNSSLTGYIASIKSKHTLLIADACFAGSIFKSRAAFPKSTRAVQRLYSLPSRKAMTSGTLKEVPDQSCDKSDQVIEEYIQ